MGNRLSERSFTIADVLDYRLEIFGITALWILIYHVNHRVHIPEFRGSYWVAIFLNRGNSGVDIFVLLSAVGLYASMEKNTPSRFYKNRLERIVAPFLIVSVPFFLLYDFYYEQDGLWQFLLNITTVNFWLDKSYAVWYVAMVVVIYLMFPLVYQLDKRTGHRSTAALLVGAVAFEYICLKSGSFLYTYGERTLSRFPVFFLGVLLAPYVLNNREKRVRGCLVAGACAVWLCAFVLLTLVPMHLVLTRYFYGIMSLCFVLVTSWICKIIPWKPVHKVLSWVGNRSLEVYMVHVLLMRILTYHNIWCLLPSMAWYPIILAVTAFVAEGVRLLSKKCALPRR